MNPVTIADFDLTPPTPGQFEELVSSLSDDERHLLLDHGEEAPFCGVFLTEKREGAYTCRLCGLPLFKGGAKFESGTGWPSFTGRSRMSVTAWSGRRSFAAAAAVIKAMSFRTGLRRPASDTASTPDRLSSRQMGNRFPTNLDGERPRARPSLSDI